VRALLKNLLFNWQTYQSFQKYVLPLYEISQDVLENFQENCHKQVSCENTPIFGPQYKNRQ